MTDLTLSILSILATPFAVYRASRMLAIEEGPARIFENLRNLYTKDDWIGRGIRCPLCISFWVGLASALLLTFAHRCKMTKLVLLWFGLSGIASWLLMRERA